MKKALVWFLMKIGQSGIAYSISPSLVSVYLSKQFIKGMKKGIKEVKK